MTARDTFLTVLRRTIANAPAEDRAALTEAIADFSSSDWDLSITGCPIMLDHIHLAAAIGNADPADYGLTTH